MYTCCLSLSDVYSHRCCVAPADILVPVSSVVAMGQPWFYLRLEAYCLDWLSEGAYGRS